MKERDVHIANLVWATPETDELLAYIARVSNPEGQKAQTPASISKLLAFMEREGHVSPFTMANICVEVDTTRRIGRQMLRHWTLAVQEFSQRYADVTELGGFVKSECRYQDNKNRQNSLEGVSEEDSEFWSKAQDEVIAVVSRVYSEARKRNIAKELCADVLPEGLTRSRCYFNGNLRTWIFYLRSRLHPSTQKEHRLVAVELAKIFQQVAPVTFSAFFSDLDWEKVQVNS